MTEGSGPGGAARWLAFDHPGSPEPVGLLRVVADRLEYLDRDGSWRADAGLTLDLVRGRTREVDAAEAARIADRLRAHRAGRTTVVVTSSPLLLDRVDHVAFIRDGRVAAFGRHRDLLEQVPEYRAVVTREEEEVASA